MEFYLTKTANWVRALYPHKAQRFSAIQSDRLRLFALKQSATSFERVRGGKERLRRRRSQATVVKATANRYFILSSGFEVSCTTRKVMGFRAESEF